jgi:hypothetical protein
MPQYIAENGSRGLKRCLLGSHRADIGLGKIPGVTLGELDRERARRGPNPQIRGLVLFPAVCCQFNDVESFLLTAR